MICIYPVWRKILAKEDFGEFGKLNRIRQYFTLSNSPTYIVLSTWINFYVCVSYKSAKISILKYFCPVKQKQDLRDPLGP